VKALFLIFALAQFTSFNDRGNLNTILEGNWQSCRGDDGEYSELVYDGPAWELHLGPRDEFAFFIGHPEDDDHTNKDNKFSAYHYKDVEALAGGRNWSVDAGRYHLVFNAILAGGSRDECESYFIKLTKRLR
jgi:hypothetical protein